MKIKIILILILICIIIISGCIFNFSEKYGEYEIDFLRNYSNYEERKAIETAEVINYTSYVNISRFDGVWANFIDLEVIAHYNNSFFQAKENKEEININYEYFVGVKLYPKLRIKIETNKRCLDISINNNHLSNIFHKGNKMYFDRELTIIALINGTESVIIKHKGETSFEKDFYHDQSFEQIYLIDMYLSYDAIWSSVGAYYVETYQIVLLDNNFNLKMIILFPSYHIVS